MARFATMAWELPTVAIRVQYLLRAVRASYFTRRRQLQTHRSWIRTDETLRLPWVTWRRMLGKRSIWNRRAMTWRVRRLGVVSAATRESTRRYVQLLRGSRTKCFRRKSAGDWLD